MQGHVSTPDKQRCSWQVAAGSHKHPSIPNVPPTKQNRSKGCHHRGIYRSSSAPGLFPTETKRLPCRMVADPQDLAGRPKTPGRWGLRFAVVGRLGWVGQQEEVRASALQEGVQEGVESRSVNAHIAIVVDVAVVVVVVLLFLFLFLLFFLSSFSFLLLILLPLPPHQILWISPTFLLLQQVCSVIELSAFRKRWVVWLARTCCGGEAILCL